MSEEGVVWAHGVRVDTVVHHGGKAWWGKQLSDVVATVRLLVHIWANQGTVNKRRGPAIGPSQVTHFLRAAPYRIIKGLQFAKIAPQEGDFAFIAQRELSP